MKTAGVMLTLLGLTVVGGVLKAPARERFYSHLRSLRNITLRHVHDSHSLAVFTEVTTLALAARLLRNVQQNLSMPVMLHVVDKTGQVPPIEWTHEAHHLLFIQNISSTQFNQSLTKASLSHYFISSAPSIFLDLSTPPPSPQVIRSLLHTCWSKLQMYNAIVLSRSTHNNSLTAHTFIPSHPNKRCSHIESGEIINFDWNNILFHSKMSNLKQCYILYSSFHIPPHSILQNQSGEIKIKGIFGDLLDLLSTNMNVQFKFERNPDVSFRDLLLKGGSDVLAIATLPSTEMYSIFDTTRKIGETGMTFATPQPRFYSPWIFVFRAFDFQTWIYILLSFLTIGFVLKIIVKFMKYEQNNLNYLPVFWCSFAAHIGNPPLNFDIRTNSGRLLIIAVLFAGMVLDTAYHCSLFREMSFPERKPNINTISDLLKSELKIRTHPVITKYLLDSEREDLVALASKFLDAPNHTQNFEFIVNRTEYGMVGETFLLHSLKNAMMDGEEFVHIGKDHYLITYYSNFYLRKQSMFTTKFDSIIERAIEVGLVKKFYKDWVPPKRWVNNKRGKDHKVELTFRNLLGGFYVWLAGIVFSVGVFVIEWIVYKLYKI